MQLRLLCELQRGGPGEGPGRPLLEVQRDVAGALVAQQVVGEAHGGEVDLLQQTGRGYTGYTLVTQPDGGGRGPGGSGRGLTAAHSRHAQDSGVELQGPPGVFDPQHRLLQREVLQTNTRSGGSVGQGSRGRLAGPMGFLRRERRRSYSQEQEAVPTLSQSVSEEEEP